MSTLRVPPGSGRTSPRRSSRTAAQLIPLIDVQEELVRRLITRGERQVTRFLDLGAGGGAFAELVMETHPGVDRRPGRLLRADGGCGGAAAEGPRRAMGVRARRSLRTRPGARRFRAGRYDAVVSALCIHHLPDERKRELYAEAYELLEAGRHLPELGARGR